MNIQHIDNMMIDLDTGEIIHFNVSKAKLQSAIDFLSTEVEIGSVVDGLIGRSVTPSTTSLFNRPSSTRGPKPKVVINPFVEQIGEIKLGFNSKPSWFDDVTYGSQRAHTGNTTVPQGLIIHLLSCMDEITTAGVLRHLNAPREALGEDLIGKRYAELVVASCRNAISAITYQLDKGEVWCEVSPLTTSLFNDAEEWLLEKEKHQPITTEQLTANLFAAGLTVEEVDNYLTKSGRL